jgi:hypothetical protein
MSCEARLRLCGDGIGSLLTSYIFGDFCGIPLSGWTGSEFDVGIWIGERARTMTKTGLVWSGLFFLACVFPPRDLLFQEQQNLRSLNFFSQNVSFP